MESIATFPHDLATRRVKRGIEWMRKNAPGYWANNLFTVRGHNAVFRPTTAPDKKTVLALAFEHESKIANEFGYVTAESVANACGLSNEKLVELGLLSASDDPNGFDQALIKAWEIALRQDFEWPTIARKHRKLKLKKGPFTPPRRRSV